MVLTTRSAGDALIVDLAGRLTMGEPAAVLRELIRREVDTDRRKFGVRYDWVLMTRRTTDEEPIDYGRRDLIDAFNQGYAECPTAQIV
jgi:hypothetical protein